MASGIGITDLKEGILFVSMKVWHFRERIVDVVSKGSEPVILAKLCGCYGMHLCISLMALKREVECQTIKYLTLG